LAGVAVRLVSVAPAALLMPMSGLGVKACLLMASGTVVSRGTRVVVCRRFIVECGAVVMMSGPTATLPGVPGLLA
jgi:hypothetical protein